MTRKLSFGEWRRLGFPETFGLNDNGNSDGRWVSIARQIRGAAKDDKEK